MQLRRARARTRRMRHQNAAGLLSKIASTTTHSQVDTTANIAAISEGSIANTTINPPILAISSEMIIIQVPRDGHPMRSSDS